MQKANKKYYGFLYADGPYTTTGKPNKQTGRFSIAGKSVVFNKKESLLYWLEKEHFDNRDGKGKRVQVSKKELRRLNSGMSIKDFNMMVNYADED